MSIGTIDINILQEQKPKLFKLLRMRSEAARDKPIKAYLLCTSRGIGHIEGNTYAGVNLDKIFLGHSIEEAIIKADKYILNSMNNEKLVSMFDLDINRILTQYDIDPNDVEKFADQFIKLASNHLCYHWIKEYEVL
jgi:hypothetical protein